jgi:EmrB/QacA subfamily drug resistance transporter
MYAEANVGTRSAFKVARSCERELYFMHIVPDWRHPSRVSYLSSPCSPRTTGPGAAACTPSDRKWILIAIILGSSLAFMDGSVVNVALPTLQSTFRANSSGIQWVIQGYALFGASLLLLGGAIGDRYGRRRTFLAGVALFALASAACAASQSLGQLIAARAIQGIGAALLIPQALSILSASFPENERGRAIGTWSAWSTVSAALGPVAGGWLMQAWSWRLIFLLNLPLVLVIFFLAPRIPESRAAQDGSPARPLDSLGATLATLSFAAIVYALSFAPQFGWQSPRVAALLAAGLLLLALFLASQANRSNAMMPLALFKIPRFFAANLLTFLLYGALGGTLYVLPFYLIQVRGYVPAAAGAVFLPMITIIFLFSARVGALVPRISDRLLMSIGALFSGAGFAAFALLDSLHGYTLSVMPAVLTLGIGLTLCVSPLTNAVMSSVPQNQTGIASAVNNALSRLSGLVAVSLLALVLAHGFTARLTAQLSRSGLPIEMRNQIEANRARLHDIPIPPSLPPRQRSQVAAILDAAFLAGFRSVMWACAISAWAGGLAVLVLLPTPTTSP